MRTLLAKSGVLVAVMALLAASSALYAPRAARAAFNDSDGDGVIDVAEQIAGSDPHDAASSPESAGGTIYLGQPLCTDGVDNDRDGLTDAADPGCVDTDGDLVDDPIEVALGSDPNDFDNIPEVSLIDAVLASLGFVTFLCTDELDNDLDGFIDAADPGCAPLDADGDGHSDVIEKTYGSDPDDPDSAPEYDGASPGSCSDGADNDQDGLLDGDDPGCQAVPTATPTAAARATPTPAATREPGPEVGGLPRTGSGPGQPAVQPRIVAVLAGAGGLMAAGWGAARLRSRRPRLGATD